MDNLNFKAGAYLGNTVVLIGKMTYVGRTSMEVRIDTYVEDSQGMRKMINRANEVMVALDENDNKVEVPGLIVETEAEKAEWQGAEKRYALRRERRIEGYQICQTMIIRQFRRRNMAKKIGIISDTHGLLRPEVLEILKTCDCILHAGDVDRPEILDQLRPLGNLYAVRGNNDGDWARGIATALRFKIENISFFIENI